MKIYLVYDPETDRYMTAGGRWRKNGKIYTKSSFCKSAIANAFNAKEFDIWKRAQILEFDLSHCETQYSILEFAGPATIKQISETLTPKQIVQLR